MERREQYDPEDMEALLAERDFSDLLEEEKAFVLRHLKDPKEYSRMRHTLLRTQESGMKEQPMRPDPALRAKVMAAFRQEQKGGFRIWLNSVLAFLAPPDVKFYLRPAVQFAMIALLVGAAFMGYFLLQKAADQMQVAEVKTQPKQEMDGSVASIPSDSSRNDVTGTAVQTRSETSDDQPDLFAASDNERRRAALESTLSENEAAPLEDVAINEEQEEGSDATDRNINKGVNTATISSAAPANVQATMDVPAADEDLAEEATARSANRVGKSKVTRERVQSGAAEVKALVDIDPALSRDLAQDERLIDLLVQAW